MIVWACNDVMITLEVEMHPVVFWRKGDSQKKMGLRRGIAKSRFVLFSIALFQSRFVLFLFGNEFTRWYKLGEICGIHATEEKIRENEDLYLSSHISAHRHLRGNIPRHRSSSRALSLSGSLHLSVRKVKKSQALP